MGHQIAPVKDRNNFYEVQTPNNFIMKPFTIFAHIKPRHLISRAWND